MQAQITDGTLTLTDSAGRYVTSRKGDWLTIPDSPDEWPPAIREAARTGQLAIAAVADQPPQQMVPEEPEPETKRGKTAKE